MNQQGWRHPSPWRTLEGLQSGHRLGRHKILRLNPRLGLLQQTCPPEHAWIHQESPRPIWTQASGKTIASTAQTHQTHLRCHSSVRRGHGCNQATLQGREEVHPTSHRHLTLLWPRRGCHHPCCTKLPSISPCNTHWRQTRHLFGYIATRLNAILSYAKNNMILSTHSNAPYLSKPKEWSCTGKHFFLSDGTNDVPNNGPILNTSQIIKLVMFLAAEAELGERST